VADVAVVCRRAIASDAEDLVQVIRSAYRGDISRHGWTSEADLVGGDRINVDQVLALINAQNSFFLVVEKDREIIGCCHIGDHGDGQSYFGTFSIRPTLQGAGLGDYLLREAERQAVVTYKSTQMELAVLDQQTKLIEWYERRGFQRTGETRPFPADEKFARPLRENLYFVVLKKDLKLQRKAGAK
jgi:N-acetylglutamate synthase-like GNAT family acetyltransferase